VIRATGTRTRSWRAFPEGVGSLSSRLEASASGLLACRAASGNAPVGFSVPILGGISQVTGKFSRFELELDYDEERPESSRVLAKIDASSSR